MIRKYVKKSVVGSRMGPEWAPKCLPNGDIFDLFHHIEILVRSLKADMVPDTLRKLTNPILDSFGSHFGQILLISCDFFEDFMIFRNTDRAKEKGKEHTQVCCIPGCFLKRMFSTLHSLKKTPRQKRPRQCLQVHKTISPKRYRHARLLNEVTQLDSKYASVKP